MWSGDGGGDVMEERAHESEVATRLPLWSRVIRLKLGRSELLVYNLPKVRKGWRKAEGRSAVRRGTWDESAATKVIDKKVDSSGRTKSSRATTVYMVQERNYLH